MSARILSISMAITVFSLSVIVAIFAAEVLWTFISTLPVGQ